MATRGCLSVDEALRSTFEAANREGSNVRFLSANLDMGAESVVLGSTFDVQSDVAAKDFARLVDNMSSPSSSAANSGAGDSRRGCPQPRLYFFCADRDRTPRVWNLVTFIPDTALVKEKMLYAACREDIKRALGQGSFGPDFYVNDVSECDFESFAEKALGIPVDMNDVLTAEERQVQEEHVESHAAMVGPATGALGGSLMSFRLDRKLTKILEDLGSGSGQEWIIAEVEFNDKEILEVVRETRLGKDGRNTFPVDEKEARFYILGHPKLKAHCTAFLFRPEGLSIKQRMLYATVESTLGDALEASGLGKARRSRVCGCDSVHELKEEIRAVIEESNAEQCGGRGGSSGAGRTTGTASTGSSGGGAGQQVTKFSRPGARGSKSKGKRGARGGKKKKRLPFGEGSNTEILS